jgi:hypothetical protein
LLFFCLIKDEIRRAVQNGGDDVGRLFLGVELNQAQARQLAQQIQESIARERRSQMEAPDADDSMDVIPVLTVVSKAPVCVREPPPMALRRRPAASSRCPAWAGTAHPGSRSPRRR